MWVKCTEFEVPIFISFKIFQRLSDKASYREASLKKIGDVYFTAQKSIVTHLVQKIFLMLCTGYRKKTQHF